MVLATIEERDPNNWTFQAPTHRLNPAPLVPPLHPRSKMALGGIDPAVMQLRYYHPNLKDREEVGRVMSDYVLQDGAFLLRNSFRKPGILTVTVMHHECIKHFNLIVRNNRYALQHEEFNTVQELVAFYGKNDVPNEESVAHLRLWHPITRPSSNLPQVPLPITKPQKEKKRFFGERRKKYKSESQLPLMDDRAPAPLPDTVPDSEKDSHYYSVINHAVLEKDRSQDLIESIAQFEEPIVEHCECGLTVAEAELPNGWSMHLSQDPATYRRLFYMGPDRETLWDLPTVIMLQLTPDQQDTIFRLKYGYPSNRGSSSGSSNTGGASNNTNSSMSFRASQPSPPYRRQPAEHECSSDEVFHPY